LLRAGLGEPTGTSGRAARTGCDPPESVGRDSALRGTRSKAMERCLLRGSSERKHLEARRRASLLEAARKRFADPGPGDPRFETLDLEAWSRASTTGVGVGRFWGRRRPEHRSRSVLPPRQRDAVKPPQLRATLSLATAPQSGKTCDSNGLMLR